MGQPLSYVRTTAVQVASSFANRMSPGSLGGAVVDVRYLRSSGLEQSDVWTTVALNSVAGGILHVGAIVVTADLVGRHGVGLFRLPDRTGVLVGLIGLLVGAGLLWSPLGRRRLVPQVTGVLAFRLVTYWAPILPGWLVFRRLLREHLI